MTTSVLVNLDVGGIQNLEHTVPGMFPDLLFKTRYEDPPLDPSPERLVYAVPLAVFLRQLIPLCSRDEYPPDAIQSVS